MSEDRFHTKPWRVNWFEPELEHRKYEKAFREDEDYSEDVTLYWGDVHKHSEISPCSDVNPYNGSLDECYEYAREAAQTDFLAIADHAERMTEEQWAESMERARAHNEPGEFVAWPAVEWASALHGHRNIYYRDYDVPLIGAHVVPTPTDLWAYLREHGIEALTIPHHTARELSCDLTVTDDELEPAFEIYSGWGNEEYYGAPRQDTDRSFTRGFYIDTLLRGYRMGVVAGGDGHPAKPAICGITGIYASELTLDGLWDALQRRRTIATTGVKIMLDFHINGFPMGSSLSFTPEDVEELFPLEIGVAVQGTAPVEKVEIIENGVVVHTKTKPRAAADMFAYRWFRRSGPTDGAKIIHTRHNISRFIYVRVTQADGHMAWSSPIWLDYRHPD
ncbi:MAG: DUF3604 domain-containing protein [Armatimonadetes bacterium]|nr:DUF3604 domain-containing protein [Armatimonadota bacterium]